MEIVHAIIAGIVQGTAEFLPISSSGHLVLLESLFQRKTELLLIVLLHVGTLFSVTVFFWKDIVKYAKNLNLLKHILLITVVTGTIGITFKDIFEKIFSSPQAVIFALFLNGTMLLFAKDKGTKTLHDITYKDSLWMGITQGIAVIPGISRSGITLVTLLFRGIKKEDAFTFSFLASLPAIFGAFLLETKESLASSQKILTTPTILGIIVAFFVGLAALFLFASCVKKSRLFLFGYYCIMLSVASYLLFC